MSKRYVLEQLATINHGRSDHIIALEEITVICLYSQLIVVPLMRILHVKQQSIIKRGLAVLTPVVAVCLERTL